MSTKELIKANYVTLKIIERYFMIAQVYSIRDEQGFFTGKNSYLRHSGLIRRVNEFRRIIVDVGHSHDHRNCPLLIGQLHRAAQLKINKYLYWR